MVLPALFGIRMCFQCPDCNADSDEVGAGSVEFECAACSDYMGCNSKLMGGYAGLATGMGFATEFQGEGTPHGHGFVSLANMFQHHTLEEIKDIIESNLRGLKPEEVLERAEQFAEHLQREDHIFCALPVPSPARVPRPPHVPAFPPLAPTPASPHFGVWKSLMQKKQALGSAIRQTITTWKCVYHVQYDSLHA